ncbi:molybdenum cofactor guanylyltransferase [Luteococcus peritonei]|uniref:Molybdenum cofactor guanylyltransferase n=1 Tax=Luteococcus peritonei TaxID=88874 RepID=A0ABW4RRV8_9ACTN
MDVMGIVLAGGGSVRMGQPKQGLELAGRSLLQRTVDACLDQGCSRVAVLAPAAQAGGWVAADERVLVTLEDPPDGGPVAGIVAGLEALSPADDDQVWVLACDLPRVDELMAALQAMELPDELAWVPVDEEGWPQFLAARYPVAALRRTVAENPGRDIAARRLLRAIPKVPVSLPGELLTDVDSPQQARAAGIELDRPRD